MLPSPCVIVWWSVVSSLQVLRKHKQRAAILHCRIPNDRTKVGRERD